MLHLLSISGWSPSVTNSTTMPLKAAFSRYDSAMERQNLTRSTRCFFHLNDTAFPSSDDSRIRFTMASCFLRMSSIVVYNSSCSSRLSSGCSCNNCRALRTLVSRDSEDHGPQSRSDCSFRDWSETSCLLICSSCLLLARMMAFCSATFAFLACSLTVCPRSSA